MKKQRSPKQQLNWDKYQVKGAFANLRRIFFGTKHYFAVLKQQEEALKALDYLFSHTSYYGNNPK